MFSEDYQKEQQVAKCKATLIKELKSVYSKLQKDGDWEAFGKRIKGIYISYSTCDNEISEMENIVEIISKITSATATTSTDLKED